MPIKPRADLPPAPSGDAGLHEDDRDIGGGAVFVLDEVKELVRNIPASAFKLTQSASDAMIHELRWTRGDLRDFIQCLEPRHYSKSLWCYGSGRPKIAFPADVYIMGYNRFRREEWLRCDPWNYFKFSICPTSNSIEVFSMHPEKKKRR